MGWLAAWADDDDAEKAPLPRPPATLKDWEKRLSRLADRLAALNELAQKDPVVQQLVYLTLIPD